MRGRKPRPDKPETLGQTIKRTLSQVVQLFPWFNGGYFVAYLDPQAEEGKTPTMQEPGRVPGHRPRDPLKWSDAEEEAALEERERGAQNVIDKRRRHSWEP